MRFEAPDNVRNNNNLKDDNDNLQSIIVHTRKHRGTKKNLTNCCYSSSNLAIIVGIVVAVVVCAIFLNDDPLYDYGEQLLSLKFYRQIVYVLVILPLALFVPLFNAFSAFFGGSSSSKWRSSSKLFTIKIVFEMLVALLILIGLIFVLPNTKWSGLASQLGIEIRKHMRIRFDNDFSYQFMDAIQREYQCCDLMWYQSNFNGQIPTSCYLPNGYFANPYEENCVDALATLISGRCIVLSFALAIILLALAFLIGVDVIGLVAQSGRSQSDLYTFNTTKPGRGNDFDDDHRSSSAPPHSQNQHQMPSLADEEIQAQKHHFAPQFQTTTSGKPRPILKNYSDEHEHQKPLIARSQSPTMNGGNGSTSMTDTRRLNTFRVANNIRDNNNNNDDDDVDVCVDNDDDNLSRFNQTQRPSTSSSINAFGRNDSPILTRAHLFESRRQHNPMHLTTTSTTTEMYEERRQTSHRQPISSIDPTKTTTAQPSTILTSSSVGSSSQRPALKKSISFQDIDETEDDDSSFSANENFSSRPQQQPKDGLRQVGYLRSHSPTPNAPRSPLGVRFAR